MSHQSVTARSYTGDAELFQFEVTVIARGICSRDVKPSDYQRVRVWAANSTSATLVAREQYDAAIAFDPRRIEVVDD